MGSSSTTFGTNYVSPNLLPIFIDVAGVDANLTVAQSATLYYVCSGTLTRNYTISFPPRLQGVWQLDSSQVIYDGYTISIVSGAGSQSLLVPSISTISIPNTDLVELTAASAINVVPLNLSVSGGNITLSPTQSLVLYIVLSGTLSADFSLTFPLFGVWQVDTKSVTFASHKINIKTGSGVSSITTNSITAVSIPKVNTVVIAPTVIVQSISFSVPGLSDGEIHFVSATVPGATIGDCVIVTLPPANYGDYIQGMPQVVATNTVGFGLLATDDIDPFTANLNVTLIRA
jgi:hypothetical protein